MAKNSIGRVTQVLGAVVDVQFEGQFTRFSDLAPDSHLPDRI